MQREPCPFRIVEDAGGSFFIGLIGGGAWNFFSGVRNAPVGTRFSTGIIKATTRGPILGGSFAIWGTCFSISDCTISYLRGKEDAMNAIASGAVTGGVLAMRAGWRQAGKNALIGGVLLAVIEGFNICITRYLVPAMDIQGQGPRHVDRLDPPNDPLRPRYVRTPLWQPQTPLLLDGGSSASLNSSSSSGVDINSLYDRPLNSGIKEEGWGYSNTDEEKQDEEAAPKPFWKFW